MPFGPHEPWWEGTGVELSYEQLAYLEDFYSISMAAAKMGVWEWWPPERRIRLHPIWIDLMGFDRFEDRFETPMRVDDYLELVHPDDRRRVGRAMARFARSEAERWECRFRMVRRSRNARSWISRGSTVDWSDGRPARVIGADLFVD